MSPDQLSRIGDDPDVFEVFYRAHVTAVERFIARRVDSPDLAADLTAEVFLAAIDSAHTYRHERGTPVAWLYGIAQTTVSASRRRAAREQRANARIHGRRLLQPDDVARLQERIDAEAQARELYEAMNALPDPERAVLELVALDELRVSEAADALGIRAVTARVRLHRARSALRDRLTETDAPTLTPMEA
ncbi:MAG: sigma-70 family RNA polymerase sigma factor [Solirubrobacteraceae bacterium]|nr:sigma-70 family RNA polymerase sigma factor [Solirubrobacteraceae bacterium]